MRFVCCYYKNGGDSYLRHEHGGNIYKHKNIIDFSANINPLGIHEDIKKAFIKSLEMAHNYPDPDCVEIRELLSIKEKVDSKNIICSNGAAEIIFAVCFAFKPKRALLCAPCFAEYEQALKVCGCDIERHILKEENCFKPDNDFIYDINNFDIMFFTNPNNPTGILSDVNYIEKIIKRAVQNNIIVVFDECFIDFIENKYMYSAKKFINQYDNIIILNAFTKFYSIPGLRLGYAVFSDSEKAYKVRECIQTWNVSVTAQYAGVAALKIDNSFDSDTIKYISKEKEYLLKNIKPIKLYGHSANFIFFKENERFGNEMLRRGIMIRDCSNYYSLGKGFYRIAVKTHEDNKRLVDIWENLIYSKKEI